MQRTGFRPEASSVLIINEPSGVPYAAREPEGRLPFSISISHRDDWGAAGVSLDPTASLGLDLETIEAIGVDWCADYFVAHEMDAVRAAGEARDRVVATIWSAKESALKALGLGLRMDPRRIEVRVAPADCSSVVLAVDGWVPLELRADPLTALGDTVRAYSLACSDYVLTAVLLTQGGQRFGRP
jgi:phosphopantetheinyl transferase